MAHEFNNTFQYKILESTRTLASLTDLPDIIQDKIQHEMASYFEVVDSVVENDDGTIESKTINYHMRDYNPESTSDQSIEYSRYNISGIGNVEIIGGTEFEKVDCDSFISTYYEVSSNETIPMHYEVYYSMCAIPEKEEVVMKEAILHTYSYLEYIESIVEQ